MEEEPQPGVMETSNDMCYLGDGMWGSWQEVSPLQSPHYCIARHCSAAQALTDLKGQQ